MISPFKSDKLDNDSIQGNTIDATMEKHLQNPE